MVAYFAGTAVADTILEGSLNGQVLEIQLGGGAVFAAIACKLIEPNERSVFIGELGDDETGKQFQKLLRDRGVEFLPELIGPRSSQAIWVVGEDGKRLMKKDLITPRDNTAEILEQIQFKAGDYFVLQSMTTTEHLDKFRATIHRALAAGAMIIFSPNTRSFIDLKKASPEEVDAAKLKRGRYLLPFKELQDISHLMTISHADMSALFFDRPKVIGAYLSALSLPAVVTMVDQPTRLYYGTPNPFAHIPVEKVLGVKNTVGTGDHTLGSLVGFLANQKINHINMTPEILERAIVAAQKSTYGELMRRRDFEQVPSSKPSFVVK